MNGRFSEYVLPDLRKWRSEGKRSALLTLYNMEPTGPRPAGSQMAVSDAGDFTGFLSGGCVEAALVEETRLAIEDGENCSIRYGEGSPYMDIIELPCGNSIDVFIDIGFDDGFVEGIIDAMDARRPVRLVTDMASGESRLEPADGPDERLQLVLDGQTFDRLYRPPLRLVATGKGPLLIAAAQLARQSGMDVTIISTEEDVVSGAEAVGAKTAKTAASVEIDAWTAVATLFHEHELEGPLLEKAMDSDAFYVGALGSRKTHANRVADFIANGRSEEEVGRIRGPLGLDIGSRNPPEIAISMIAEIFKVYRERFPV